MPPRLPSQRTVFLVASSSACPRTTSQTLSSCGARRALTSFAAHKTQGESQGAKLCFRTSCHGSQQKRTFRSSARSHASQKNPYEVLGLKKDAGTSEIKRAYYQLAKQFHPDTNKDKGAHERFVEIQTAYDLLSDDKKRAAYDRYGAASQQEGFDPDAFSNGRGPFGAGGFGFQDLGSAFGAAGGRSQADLFETLFGSAFGGRGSRTKGPGFETYRGDDIEASVGVSFLEACKGTKRTVTVTPVMDCNTCSGSGLKPGAKRSTCSACGGSGTRTFVIESGFQMASTCPTCSGTGTTVSRGSQCGDCSGLGKVKIRKTVPVDIPPGVEDGMTLRVPGAGDMPISGQGNPGDLLVRVNVATSKIFRRQGVNVYHDARIPMHTAVLGGKLRVPSLDGEVDVRVPAGTQHGEEYILKGRGVPPVMGGEKGDLFVAFAVHLPRSLTPRQREILQQYADDVEGRTTLSTSASGPTGPVAGGGTEEKEKETTNKPGMDSFTSSEGPPRPPGDWLPRTWGKIKQLIGH